MCSHLHGGSNDGDHQYGPKITQVKLSEQWQALNKCELFSLFEVGLIYPKEWKGFPSLV